MIEGIPITMKIISNSIGWLFHGNRFKATSVIIYKKSTSDGFSLYYEEVRTKRKQLAFKTMYKVKE